MALPRVRPDVVAEHGLVVAALRGGRCPPSWTSVQPAGRSAGRVELLVDDRALSDGRPDRREAAAAQRAEQLVERLALDYLQRALRRHRGRSLLRGRRGAAVEGRLQIEHDLIEGTVGPHQQVSSCRHLVQRLELGRLRAAISAVASDTRPGSSSRDLARCSTTLRGAPALDEEGGAPEGLGERRPVRAAPERRVDDRAAVPPPRVRRARGRCARCMPRCRARRGPLLGSRPASSLRTMSELRCGEPGQRADRLGEDGLAGCRAAADHQHERATRPPRQPAGQPGKPARLRDRPGPLVAPRAARPPAGTPPSRAPRPGTRRRRTAAPARRGRRPPPRTRRPESRRGLGAEAIRSMTRNARSAQTSIWRSAGSNSTGSKTSTDPASRITCSARRSPWQSRTKPRATRSSSSPRPRVQERDGEADARPRAPARRTAAAYGSSVLKFSLTVAATAPASNCPAGACGADGGTAAIRRATARRSPRPPSPLLSSAASVQAASKRRISTTCSSPSIARRAERPAAVGATSGRTPR